MSPAAKTWKDRAMKVVQILFSGLGGHGAVAFALEAAERAAAGGWRHQMIFLGTEPLLPEYAALCAARGIEHVYVPATAGRPWKSWTGLLRALGRLRPDAIILHSVKTVLPVWLHARTRGASLIAVEHQANALKTRAEWGASRALMALADRVVVLTPDYRDALAAGIGPAFRPAKVALIPNGVDTTVYAPADRPRPGARRPVRVGMAARFAGNKRHEALLAALRLLLDRDGPDAWTLSLAGDGDTRPAVMAEAERLGLGAAVDFPGFLGAETLPPWFGGLDIYVHASDGETLSTSLLQAMACGLPIAGSDVAGITDLLAMGGGCGIVSPGQDGPGFAAVLTRYVEDGELAASLGANARALAVETYSQDAMFRAYRALVEAA